MTRLLLLRHGQSEGNAARRLQGQVPYPLTARGRLQGEALAARVRAEGAHLLYTSPTRRALETGEIIAAATGLPLLVRDDLREYDFGSRSGLAIDEIAKQDLEWALAVREGRPTPEVDDEEGHGPFRERVCAAFWQLSDLHPDKTVAVVTHYWAISVFTQAALGVRIGKPAGFLAIDNCSITAIDALPAAEAPPGGPRAVIVALNEACHVRRPPAAR